MAEYSAPWETQEVQLIIQMFGGKVTNLQNISVIEIPTEVNNEGIQR